MFNLLIAPIAQAQQIESTDFYSIQKKFEAKWKGKNTLKGTDTKGKGWKQFKRWENFMQPRVYPSGQFANNGVLWDESSRYNLTNNVKNTLKAGSSEWQPIGPAEVPGNINNPEIKMGAGRIDCIAFHPTDENIIYVGSPTGGAWKTSNGGASWNPITQNMPTMGISDIEVDPINPDVIYLATGDRDSWSEGGNQQFGSYSVGILKSTNGGDTWQLTGLNYKIMDNIMVNDMVINPTNSQIIVAATNLGIYRSVDGGGTWAIVAIGHNIKDLKTLVSQPEIIYASSTNAYGNSVILKSSNAGLSFVELKNTGIINAGRIEIGLTPANPNAVYALASVADNGGFLGLYKSGDKGETWTTITSNEKINLFDWNYDGGGYGGQGYYDIALAVDPQDENLIRVGAINIWKSANGGTDWSIESMWNYDYGIDYVHADQHAFEYNPLNNNLYAGNDGGIYKYDKVTGRWGDISSNLSILQVYRLGLSATNSDVYVAGNQDNGSYLRGENGDWHSILGGDGMECIIDYTDKNIIYTEYYNGGLNRSDDGGKTYKYISPTYGYSAWITPYIMHPSSPNILFLGGTGVIYKTTDKGDNWEQIGTLGNAEIQSLAISKSDPNCLYAASYTNIWVTKNGGESWQDITLGLPSASITYIAVADNDPNKIWISFSGYFKENKVYFSNNGGQDWTNYSDGLPNVPANSIVYQNSSKDALYLATDLGVFYRNADMPVWIPFNNGLPNMIVYEVEIQYATQKLIAATYGQGLWSADLYTTKDIDLGVSHINSPANSFDLTAIETVQIEVLNYGNTEQTNFEVAYQINDGNIVQETVSSTLLPGQSLSYSFLQKADFSGPGLYKVKVFTSIATDQDKANDAFFTELHNYLSNQNPETGNFALNFKSLNHFINCGNDPSINITGAFTIEAWINPINFGELDGAGFGRIVDKGNINLFLNGNYPYYKNNSVLLSVTSPFGERLYAGTGENSVELGVWQHVAVVYDAENSIRMYINGKETEVILYSSGFGNVLDNTEYDLYIGENKNLNRAFNGLIDEVRMWNTVRNPDQIEMNMCDVDPQTAGLKGYWRFNEGSGSLVVLDHTANKNHGYLSNFNVKDGILSDWQEEMHGCFANDLSIDAVLEPVSKNNMTNSEFVKLLIHNRGSLPQSGFDINYKIENNALVTRQFTETIPAYSVAEFTFDQMEDFSAKGLYLIQAGVNSVADENNSNNTIEKHVINDDYCNASSGKTENRAHIQKVSLAGKTFTSGYSGYSIQTDAFNIHLNKQYVVDIVGLGKADLYSCAVAIDWNADNDFDDTDELYTAIQEGNLFRATFIGPENGVRTKTRMRVLYALNEVTISSACAIFSEGEVEDYFIQTLDPLSVEAEITSFSVENQIGETIIDNLNRKVTVFLPKGTELWSIVPSFTLSTNAKAYVYGMLQTSGKSSVDFTNIAEYTIFPEDETHSRVWQVQVRYELNDKAEIVAYSVPGQLTVCRISKANHEITVYLGQTANINAIAPNFILSSGANTFVNDVEQISGQSLNDFSNDVVYNVVSENGLVNQAWTVKMTKPTGTDALDNNKLKVYPNPSDGRFVIENAAKSTVQVYTISGQKVFTKEDISAVHQLDVSFLPGGTYILLIKYEDSFDSYNIILNK